MICLTIPDEELLDVTPGSIGNLEFIGLIEMENLDKTFTNNLLIASGSNCLVLCAVKDIKRDKLYLGRIDGIWDYYYMKDISKQISHIATIKYKPIELNILSSDLSESLLGINFLRTRELEFLPKLEDSMIELSIL